jgi:hypothetical protein
MMAESKEAEEIQYEQLRRMAQELHIPIPEAFWELEVRDKHGNVTQRHQQRSHSWTRNAYNMLLSNLAGKDGDDPTFGAGKLNCKATSGTVRSGDSPLLISPRNTYSVDGIQFGYRATGADASYGILVGSGTNAENFEDYALQTQIVEGSGAGQLSHVLSEEHSVSYDAGAKILKNELVRYFNNNSGGDVNVNEVALVGFVGCCGTANDKVLMSRDKLTSTVTVPDTGQLKVTYNVQLTYPT